jgi:decaprenyl-phosphate phosphoribosyltransferase
MPPHGSAGLAADVRPARGAAHAVLATARPRQWLKNALVVAAAGAAGALGHDDVPGRVLLACAAFCMLASGIYAINDVRDADEDRLHPRKCRRPVAAGEIAPRTAAVAGVGSILAGLALCAAIRPLLAVVGTGYVVLTVSYTMLWRHLLLLDILAIAGGFVLRAVAGGVAAPVELSHWFLMVVSAAAVLVAAGKRRAELLRTVDGVAPRRRVLDGYSDAMLRAILVGGAAFALVSYCMWAFEVPIPGAVPWRVVTIVPFVAALGRYGMLVRGGEGETPEDLLLGDRPLQLAAAAWLLSFALAVNAGS